ncbi:branched-chain amino acid transport system II carrier protein [Aerococcaceae bacterium DSM 111020]|nr:branched-chain amino acid transport system II carrier protein [Aerococcaceae bacterium DSM 111020]
MNNKFTFNNALVIGSMLFGLFFGAGNLIFPLMLGQQAAANLYPAMIGFLITAVGLPLLGVNALGVTKRNDLYDLVTFILPKQLGRLFTLVLYLTIGPLFAIPRLATVSHEIGVAPFVDGRLSLLIFSLIFFGIVWYFSLSESDIIEVVGKYLNPIFLVLIGILIVMSFINPMGSPTANMPSEPYNTHALTTGLQDGYNTMDAIASLAFGIIVIKAIKGLGLTDSKMISRSVLKAGIVSSILMILIYGPLIWMGASQINLFGHSTNGGAILAKIANHYLASFGSIMLLITVTVACIKTGIGLIIATAEMLQIMYPGKFTYKNVVAVLIFISVIIANFGLEAIISLSLPALVFIYPFTIVIIVLANISPLFNHHKQVYRWALIATLPFAFFDMIKATPLNNVSVISGIIDWLNNYWPLFSSGLGWVLPAIAAALIAIIITKNNSF